MFTLAYKIDETFRPLIALSVAEVGVISLHIFVDIAIMLTIYTRATQNSKCKLSIFIKIYKS
jgi:hypothetical protein